LPDEIEEESPRHVGGGGGIFHIFTLESLDEGGGAVWQRLEPPTSWRREGGEAVRLEREANLP
jgi:hypothetical protein